MARALGDFSLQPYVTPEPEVIGPIIVEPDGKVIYLCVPLGLYCGSAAMYKCSCERDLSKGKAASYQPR